MAKNEMVALGLIYSEPCHTYVLDRLINEMRLEQWANISKASIYNSLHLLVEEHIIQKITRGGMGISLPSISGVKEK